MPKKKTTKTTRKHKTKPAIEPVEKNSDEPQKKSEATETKVKEAAVKATPEPTPTQPEESIEKISWWQHLKKDRKLQVMLVVIAGLVLMAGTITAAVLLQPQTKIDEVILIEDNTNETVIEEPVITAPTILPRHLDGLLVAAADANKVPACVMIENAAFGGVRPQAGLSAAQVVYEVIVEGGITRLMAVFAGEKADMVGPVRSARDTYLEFASELNCAYIHAGGSFTAVQALRNLKMRDIDALLEYKWFWRQAGKAAPHDLFTKTDNVYEAIKSGHSWTEEPTYAVWNFVDDENIEATETATEVNIAFGGAYDVKYIYNVDGQYYERWDGGVVHTDANTGKALTARNIIIQKVPPGEEIEGKGRINFSVTGEGEVYIFRLGKLTKGTWKKNDRLSRTQFFDATGEEIPLARGTTWVEIVPETHPFDWK